MTLAVLRIQAIQVHSEPARMAQVGLVSTNASIGHTCVHHKDVGNDC